MGWFALLVALAVIGLAWWGFVELFEDDEDDAYEQSAATYGVAPLTPLGTTAVDDPVVAEEPTFGWLEEEDSAWTDMNQYAIEGTVDYGDPQIEEAPMQPESQAMAPDAAVVLAQPEASSDAATTGEVALSQADLKRLASFWERVKSRAYIIGMNIIEPMYDSPYDEDQKMGSVVMADKPETLNELEQPVSSYAYNAMTSVNQPLRALAKAPQRFAGMTIDGTADVDQVISDRGFWLEQDGQRIFALIDEEGREVLHISQGQRVAFAAEIASPEVVETFATGLDRDSVEAIRGEPFFLAIEHDNINILER